MAGINPRARIVHVRVADVKTVREAVSARVSDGAVGGERLIAGGLLKDFRAAALAAGVEDGVLRLTAGSPFAVGDEVLHADF